MWPFKSKPVQTFAELAETFPPAPCGQQADHWRWIKIEGMVCPRCHAEKVRKEKDQERELLAESIATRVAAKLAAASGT